MTTRRGFRLLLAVHALALVLVGGPLHGQEAGSWTIDARVGGGQALDDLAELRVHPRGVAAGLGLARPLSPWLTVRFDADALFLSADTARGNAAGSAQPGSDMRLIHVTAGSDVRLTPASWRWDVTAWAGGGFTVWAVDRFTVDTTSDSFQHTYPVAGLGLGVAYAHSPALSVYLRSRGYLTFTGRGDTRALGPITRPDDHPEQGDGIAEEEFISRAIDVPLTLGVRWNP
jgi:hypothetical protein